MTIPIISVKARIPMMAMIGPAILLLKFVVGVKVFLVGLFGGTEAEAAKAEAEAEAVKAEAARKRRGAAS